VIDCTLFRSHGRGEESEREREMVGCVGTARSCGSTGPRSRNALGRVKWNALQTCVPVQYTTPVASHLPKQQDIEPSGYRRAGKCSEEDRRPGQYIGLG